MIGTVIVATGACAAVWAGGYLLGARRGTQARGALRDQLEAAQQRAGTAEARVGAAEARAEALAQSGASASALSAELARRLEPLEAQEAQLRRLAVQVDQALAQTNQRGRLTENLQALLAPVKAQADETARLREEVRRLSKPSDPRADEARLRRVVAEAIRPITEQDRLGAALASVESGTGRADLNALLDAVARRAGFTAVLLSDASGLLLANSTQAKDAELRAGVSSLLVTLAERFAKSGLATPRAILLHDDANQTAVSRLFCVDEDRFLLTAVTAGQTLAPTVLDPVLEKIEALMSDWTVSPRRGTRPLAQAS